MFKGTMILNHQLMHLLLQLHLLYILHNRILIIIMQPMASIPTCRLALLMYPVKQIYWLHNIMVPVQRLVIIQEALN